MFPFTEEELLTALRRLGDKYLNKQYRHLWSSDNPAAGYCAIVSRFIVMADLMPPGYSVYRERYSNGDSHYYFEHEATGRQLDLTMSQFGRHIIHQGQPLRTWMPQVNKGVYALAEELGVPVYDSRKMLKR